MGPVHIFISVHVREDGATKEVFQLIWKTSISEDKVINDTPQANAVACGAEPKSVRVARRELFKVAAFIRKFTKLRNFRRKTQTQYRERIHNDVISKLLKFHSVVYNCSGDTGVPSGLSYLYTKFRKKIGTVTIMGVYCHLFESYL